MKKSLLLMLLVLAISFCACSPNQPSSTVSSQAVASSATSVAAKFSMLTGNWGAQEGCGTEDGFYYLNRINENAYRILYVDYTTYTETPLCPLPDCSHDDETCRAWLLVPNCGASIFADADYLYIMTFADGSRDQNKEFPRLYRFDKNGSDRKLLLELSNGESFSRDVATDGEALYVNIVGTALNQQGLSDYSTIQKIDIDSGTTETIVDLQTNAQLRSAYDDVLIFQSVNIPEYPTESDLENITNSLFEISVPEKSKKDIIHWANGDASVIIYDDNIYAFDYASSSIYKQAAINTASKRTLCDVPNDITYDQCIFIYIDSDILVFDLIKYGAPPAKRYALSFADNQIHQIFLEYTDGEALRPYGIKAETADGLFVQCGVQVLDKQDVFSNGEIDNFTYTKPLFGIIKTSDYLNNSNQMQPVL